MRGGFDFASDGSDAAHEVLALGLDRGAGADIYRGECTMLFSHYGLGTSCRSTGSRVQGGITSE